MKINCLAYTLVTLLMQCTYAQTAVLSSGGNENGSGGNISLSIGAVIYHIDTENNGYLLAGTLQPYEISVDREDASPTVNYMYAIYPNPTSKYLTVSIQNFGQIPVEYSIISLLGVVVKSGEISSNLHKIDLENLVNSAYFLVISNGQNRLKAIKFIKQ
ncbi:MAG: T9SS type A sorting domain-containing protein [Lutibacter sp.]|nr:T9SS type A sorting domain-containing protein [Lutibacter sp.]